MIGKAKSISHAGQLIDYTKDKLQAVELDKNLVAGETSQEITNEFKTFQQLNDRCEKDSISLVISPTIEDSKKLSKQDFKDITKDFMREMKLDQHQYVSYLHEDKKHSHIHIICNRCDEQGQALNDSFISNRASRAAEKIAIERDFTLANDVRKEKELKLQKELDKEMKAIKDIHKTTLDKNPRNIAEYSKLMEKQGIKVHPKFSNANKCVGIKFQVGEKMIKGSLLGKAFSGMRIETAILNQVVKVLNISKNKSIGREL